MNERIIELADKAVEDISSGPWNISDEFCIKFAELIIRECVQVCEPILDEPYEDMTEFGKGLVEGQDVAIERIKEHFGVEE